MKIKPKTCGIKKLVTSRLRLKKFSCKRVTIKKFIPYVLAFIYHLEKYINKGICLTFSYLQRWAYGMT